MHSLKPTGLPPDRRRSSAMKAIISSGVEKAEWRAGDRQSSPSATPRMAAISAVTLAPGSTPPWPGLAPWLSLISIILICSVRGDRGEFRAVEAALRRPAAEIARADLPDDVAALLLVIGAEAALAGVMGEAALPGARVERADRIGAQRAEAHRRDVEHGNRIGPRAIGAADADAERLDRDRPRRDRMLQPFEAGRVDVELGAERPLVERHLGALVDDRALVARERQAVGLALEEILPHFRPDFLEQEPQMRRDRIVAQHRMAGLDEVAQADRDEREADHAARFRTECPSASASRRRSSTARRSTSTQSVRTMYRGVNGRIRARKDSLPASLARPPRAFRPAAN